MLLSAYQAGIQALFNTIYSGERYQMLLEHTGNDFLSVSYPCKQHDYTWPTGVHWGAWLYVETSGSLNDFPLYLSSQENGWNIRQLTILVKVQ